MMKYIPFYTLLYIYFPTFFIFKSIIQFRMYQSEIGMLLFPICAVFNICIKRHKIKCLSQYIFKQIFFMERWWKWAFAKKLCKNISQLHRKFLLCEFQHTDRNIWRCETFFTLYHQKVYRACVTKISLYSNLLTFTHVHSDGILDFLTKYPSVHLF